MRNLQYLIQAVHEQFQVKRETASAKVLNIKTSFQISEVNVHSFFHGGGVLIFTLLLPPGRRRVNSYTHPPHKTERREGGREGGRRGV